MPNHALIKYFIAEPQKAFRDFIKSEAYLTFSRRSRLRNTDNGQLQRQVRTLSNESVDIYCDMFNAVIRWLDEKQIIFSAMTEDQLFAFLTRQDDSGEPILKSAIQYRYLRLIEIVFSYLEIEPNPVQGVLFKSFQEVIRLEGRNKKSVALTANQINDFINALPVSTAQVRSDRQHAGWKKKRDRALQCVMLGAGLKVTEAIGLTIAELCQTKEIDGTLRITIKPTGKNKTSYEHITFVQPEFVDEILTWCKERATLEMDSLLLFPNHHGSALVASAVYKQVKKTFKQAGLNLPRQGGRTLRNTFGYKEFLLANDVKIVKDKLGLAEHRSALAYKTIADQLQK